MTDVVVTVPKALWSEWLEEGDLAGEPWSRDASYHFWIPQHSLPSIRPGDRVYVVAHGRLRGYSPLVRVERYCKLRPERACLMRLNDAEAMTIPETVRGFQGWRYRWWAWDDEISFADWKTAGVK